MAIQIQNRRSGPRVATPRVRKILRTICAGLGFERPELSVVLTDDAAIQDLNKTWRNKDNPTDVLSFSQVEGEGPEALGVLGDVIISTDTAQRQADALGH